MNNLTGKKIILFGAGLVGKRALTYFGSRNVHCFVDNKKSGNFYYGKHIISFDEMRKIHEDYDLVITLGRRLFLDVEKQLLSAGITKFCFFDSLLRVEDFESDPRLSILKNTHVGEKCFVIGNGPSLRAADLDILSNNNIFSFACNRIFKIFDQTKWRPNVFCIEDPYVLTTDMNAVANLDIDLKLLAHPRYTKLGEEYKPSQESSGQTLFFSHIPVFINDHSYLEPAKCFSSDPSRCTIAGHTVTYSMIQWAVYMGFSDIYLLGVDNSYATNPRNSKANNDTDHFVSDYIDEALSKAIGFLDFSPEEIFKQTTNTYKAAEAYSREHGFRIYNATRGGKLEVFERVDFDSLF